MSAAYCIFNDVTGVGVVWTCWLFVIHICIYIKKWSYGTYISIYNIFFEEVVLPLLGINGSMMGCSFIYDLTYKNVGTLVVEIIILMAVIAGTYMLRIRKKDEI